MAKAAKQQRETIFQTIVTNLSGMVRHDTLEGRDCLVVPVVMLVEGVAEGSQGPLYYPTEELAELPAVWNGRPVVVQHPGMESGGIANQPDVYNSQRVGTIFNAHIEGNRLKAEAWMEPSRLQEVDVRVLDAVKQGTMLEVSTGLFIENDDTPGTFNGKDYIAIARGLKPDHLAILPDSVGACSIADGAGLCRNELSHSDIRDKIYAALGPGGDEPSDVFILDVFDEFFIFEQAGELFHQKYATTEDSVNLEGMRQPVVRTIQYKLANGTLVGNMELVTNRVEKRGDKWCVVHGHPKKPGSKTDKPEGSVIKCFKTKAEAQAMHRAIMANNINEIDVHETETEVKKMDKEKIVNEIIANERLAWTEEDRDWLMGLEEDQLGKLAPVANEGDGDGDGEKDPPKEDPPAAIEDGEEGQGDSPPVTNAADFMAQMPPEVKEVFEDALQTNATVRADLIKTITTNERNIFTKEQLAAMRVADLKAVAALAQVPEVEKSTTLPSFLGMAPVANVGEVEEEPLALPKMTFEN